MPNTMAVDGRTLEFLEALPISREVLEGIVGK